MEPCKKATTYLEDLENQKGPADHTDHHENLDHQILRLECIVSLHGHRMGEKEVPLLKYTFHVGGNFTSMPFKYEGDSVAEALKLVCERSGCLFFLEHGNEHCIFNPQCGDRGLNLLGTRLIHNDGEREVGVEEVQTCENHNDDGGDEKEDHDFEPSTDEESDEDLQKIHLMRIWMDI
ncbi:hypothetical protein Tco_1137367 [Tanacetum coccineum]